jgi:hypothetical protein
MSEEAARGPEFRTITGEMWAVALVKARERREQRERDRRAFIRGCEARLRALERQSVVTEEISARQLETKGNDL